MIVSRITLFFLLYVFLAPALWGQKNNIIYSANLSYYSGLYGGNSLLPGITLKTKKLSITIGPRLRPKTASYLWSFEPVSIHHNSIGWHGSAAWYPVNADSKIRILPFFSFRYTGIRYRMYSFIPENQFNKIFTENEFFISSGLELKIMSRLSLGFEIGYVLSRSILYPLNRGYNLASGFDCLVSLSYRFKNSK